LDKSISRSIRSFKTPKVFFAAKGSILNEIFLLSDGCTFPIKPIELIPRSAARAVKTPTAPLTLPSVKRSRLISLSLSASSLLYTKPVTSAASFWSAGLNPPIAMVVFIPHFSAISSTSFKISNIPCGPSCGWLSPVRIRRGGVELGIAHNSA
jgi:hypothetical protein